MDRIRNCYRQRIRPYADSDYSVEIAWYRAAPGALWYEPLTPFRSSTWQLPDGQPQFHVGEFGARSYYGGNNWLGLQGQGEVCGDPEVWAGRGKAPQVVTREAGDDGVSLCCERGPVMSGGGAGGGSWGVSIPWQGGGGGGGSWGLLLPGVFSGGGSGGGVFPSLSPVASSGGGAGGESWPALVPYGSAGGGAGGSEWSLGGVECPCSGVPLAPTWDYMISAESGCPCLTGVSGQLSLLPDSGGQIWVGNLLPLGSQCAGLVGLIFLRCFPGVGWRVQLTGQSYNWEEAWAPLGLPYGERTYQGVVPFPLCSQPPWNFTLRISAAGG